MIEGVITEINSGITDLNIFSKVNGLCEIIQEVQKDSESNEILSEFPALYNGTDNLRYVTNFDYKSGVVFHLPSGDITTTDLERVRIREKRVEKIWPCKAIAIIRRNIYNTDNSFSPIELITNLEAKISKQSIPALKPILNIDKVMVNVTGSSYDKKAIIEETFININFPAMHNLMVVRIDYNIVMQGSEQCFTAYEC